MPIKLIKAKFCINCETIFDYGDRCPDCASDAWQWLYNWFKGRVAA